MSGQKAQDQLRAERLAAELRANLKKRKARARALKAESSQGGDGGPAVDTHVPDHDKD